MFKERELIKDMKILLECTDMGGLQRNADNLIGRAIELLAQHEPAPIPQRAPMTQREAYQRGYAAAREEYKQKVINAFGVDDE